VGAAFGLYGLYALSTPVWLGGPMQHYMRQAALQQAQQAPQIYPDPNQYADMMSGFVTAGLVIGVILGGAIAAVAFIGTLRRWTWMYYAILVILGLAVLSLPVQLASATGLVSSPGGVAMPPAASWVGATSGVLAIALLAWMMVALLTRGPWAMRRESAA
jgi:fucose permease